MSWPRRWKTFSQGRRAKVGDFVYRNGSPQKAGIVTAIKPGTENNNFATIAVRWLNDTLEELDEGQVKDLGWLLHDAEHKAKTHRATWEKLEKMRDQSS